MPDWDVERARALYNIAHWGGGYFDIDDAGWVVARPDRNPAGPGIELHALARELGAAGLRLPVLVRFGDILRNRVDTLCNAFAAAMEAENYRGSFTAVYPIKVNQHRSVVEQILTHGGVRVGLEAGSKPELMAVLALSDARGGVVVCNGYKDREYVRLALIGRALGHRIHLVIEKLSELELVIAESRALGIDPLLGVRVRLASIGAGKWQNTGGEKSKFGLSAAQLLRAVERLRETGMLGALQLLHFHLGSQIANIRDIQRGMHECGRYYAELHRLGVELRCVDVGGGLGVDYEGTRSRSFCSMNYSVEEYANDVVQILGEVCAAHALPYPDIITESGRAMTAHHAVLITNVIDTEQAGDARAPAPPSPDDPVILKDLWQGLQELSSRSAMEAYHDAAHWLAEANDMYIHGVLGLEQRAHAEQLYVATCMRLRQLLQPSSRAHREALDELNEKLADKYFLNFSLFQSMPDVWAIDQIFPILPLHRLDEPPERRAVIEDLTCDSDGRVDYYVDQEGMETTLPLHAWHREAPYLIGIFLVGAYQEILGDIHNLFGDTDSVDLQLKADGGYRLLHARHGDTVQDVLGYVQFRADDLLQAYRTKIAAADLTAAQRERYLAELTDGLHGYTYLED